MPSEIRLRLPEDGHGAVSVWAGSLIALGARLARVANDPGAQLTVAITLPSRELGAVLIAAGWLLTRPVPPGLSTEQALSLDPGQWVAFAAGNTIVVDQFHKKEFIGESWRLHIGGSRYLLDKLRGLAVVGPSPDRRRGAVTTGGSFPTSYGLDEQWLDMQLVSRTDVAILGTKAWILDDLQIEIGAGDDPATWNKLEHLLRPKDSHRATWQSEIFPSVAYDGDGIPDTADLVLLDGNSAIAWLPKITSRVVVGVISRASENDVAVESVLQARSSKRLVAMSDIGWNPPGGIEAMAFEARDADA